MTRVFSFKMGRDGSSRVYPESGVDDGRSTRRRTTASNEDASREFAQINRYHVSLLPYFLEKLKNIQDGDAQPARQDADHLRIADGRLERAQPQALPAVPRSATPTACSKGNMHLKAPDGTPMANAMLTRAARPRPRTTCESFGDSTGTLESERGADDASVVDG